MKPVNKKKKVLHRPGIEPGPPAWQASILPLNQRCFIAEQMKLNFLILFTITAMKTKENDTFLHMICIAMTANA